VTVIASVPAGRADVVSVAVLVRLPVVVRVAVPIAVDPFTNVTDPVGAAEVPVSVAVNVTACPTYAGFNEEVTDAVATDAPVLHV
jgi:hypothetical protein